VTAERREDWDIGFWKPIDGGGHMQREHIDDFGTDATRQRLLLGRPVRHRTCALLPLRANMTETLLKP